jgi:hypothetical protein
MMQMRTKLLAFLASLLCSALSLFGQNFTSPYYTVKELVGFYPIAMNNAGTIAGVIGGNRAGIYQDGVVKDLSTMWAPLNAKTGFPSSV